MNTHKWLIVSTSTVLTALLMLILAVGLSRAEEGVGAASAAFQPPEIPKLTAFTYQGRLTDGGSPANGEYDFRFRLYDALSGGTTLTDTRYLGNVQVTDGLFSVQIDFGNDVFTGAARWLEIAVRPGDSTGSYTTLSPRHELTPAPYALALPGLWTRQTGGSPDIIGGYVSNVVTPGVVGAVIAGGGEDNYPNTVQADHTVIGGGRGNVIGGNSYDSTVGGGWANDIGPNSGESTIGGGQNNNIGTNSGFTTIGGGAGGSVGEGSRSVTIGGGASNTVGDSSDNATVAGGGSNDVGDNSDNAVIGGGQYNVVGDDSWYATISGGAANEIRDDSPYSTIGGGLYNFISGTAEFATIAGGGPFDPYDPNTNNRVYDDYGTIGGGAYNRVGSNDGDSTNADFATIAGGVFNEAGDNYATVGGGGWNLATGYVATIPGGAGNQAAGSWSFAAGRYAHANNQGCFVWGDSVNDEIHCNDNNRTIFRSTGGFYIYTNDAVPPSGLYLAQDGNAWNTHSDRNVKENFQPVDTRQLLDRLARMPISTWNYISQDPAIRHVGPMAQDFNALLPGLGGEGETYINTLDADGVALAAIQGLYAQNQELAAQNAELEARLDGLESRLAALEQGGASRSPALSTWLLLGGLVAVGVVAQRRRPAGGGE
jgi:hypothetical protein